MPVGFTCPSLRKQDPIAVMNQEPVGPCPGHAGECRIMHTPRFIEDFEVTKDALAVLAARLEDSSNDN